MAIIAFYGRASDFGVVQFDDYDLIAKYDELAKGHSFREALSTSNFTSMYRPMLQLSFFIDALRSAQNPLDYHQTNILIHILAACSLFIFFLVLGYSTPLSLGLVLLFAVHPLAVQAVCWISGRNDSLLLLFVLLSLIGFVAMVRSERKKIYWCAAHAAFLLAALLTKESALALPVLCILLYRSIDHPPFDRRHKITTGIAWGACFLVYCALRLSSSADAGASNVVGMRAIAHNLPGFFAIIGKAFLPVRMSGYPSYEGLSIGSGIAACCLVAGLVLGVKRLRTNRMLLGAAWVALIYAPVLLLKLSDVSFDYLEHRAYACLPGLLLMLAEGRAFCKRFPRGVVAAVALVVIGFYGARAATYMETFRNPERFWRNVVACAPRCAQGYQTLANEERMKGRIPDAERLIRQSIAIDPANKASLNILSATLFQEGRYADAVEAGRSALARDSAFAEAEQNLGAACAALGRYGEAEQYLRAAIRHDPDLSIARENLAKLDAILGGRAGTKGVSGR